MGIIYLKKRGCEWPDWTIIEKLHQLPYWKVYTIDHKLASFE